MNLLSKFDKLGTGNIFDVSFHD